MWQTLNLISLFDKLGPMMANFWYRDRLMLHFSDRPSDGNSMLIHGSDADFAVGVLYRDNPH